MNRLSFSLILSLFPILLMGLLMIYNITAAEVLDRELEISPHHIFLKQFSFTIFAFLVAWTTYKIGYKKILKHSLACVLIGGVLLVLVYIPSIGQQINGANRWIGLKGISFQPSELMKFFIPLYYIDYCCQKRLDLDGRSFLKIFSFISLFIALILFEPDNGTSALLFLTLFICFFLTKIHWKYWALPLISFIFIGAGIATQMKHVPDRIRVYLNPESDIYGKGHQPYQAKIAAGSGRLWGKGFGASLQKFNYLPEARSDYIAAIFAEEFGFIGMLFLILSYMFFAFFGFQIALRANDPEGFYTAAIFTFLIGVQAFINLGVVSNLLPSKGTSLPFFSQGGSSLLANFIAVSILLSISQGAKERVRNL